MTLREGLWVSSGWRLRLRLRTIFPKTMIVLASFFIGLLTAVAGAFATGLVAAGCVEWYRIPSREGGSGYFVVFLGLLGGIVGFILGCFSGGVMEADSGAGFGKGLLAAMVIVLALNGTAAIIARLLADIPPVIDGEDLFLIVEFRMPGEDQAPPVIEGGGASVMLGSIPRGSHTVRKHERGPIWLDEAKFIDGHWVIRGAVGIFTRRGKRMISATVGEKINEGFILPLPARPGKKFLEWSDRLPRRRKDGTPPMNRLSYRFRVQRWSTPMKTETVGPFEIDTITRQFFYDEYKGSPCITSRDTFRIRHRGRRFAIDVKADEQGEIAEHKDEFVFVATLPSESPALLVQIRKYSGSNGFYLLHESAERPITEFVADGYDLATFPEVEAAAPPAGPVYTRSPDRGVLLAGWYLLGRTGMLNTRTLAVHRFAAIPMTYDSSSTQPLSLSPDERSFVRILEAMAESGKSTTVLAVTDFVADRSYLLPIDRARMRFSRIGEVNAAWVDHHFTWKRDEHGIDQFVERADFQPLPYRGEFRPAFAGRQEYRLDLVGEDMRTAVESMLIEHFKAERQPDATDYEHLFKLDGQQVSVCCGSEFAYVSVTFDPGVDEAVGKSFAELFDAELATGKYDSLFHV